MIIATVLFKKIQLICGSLLILLIQHQEALFIMRNFKHHKQRSNGFTMVPNEIFMDRRLDDKTLGVLCRLLSLPEDWNFSITGLTKITNSGRDSVRVSLNKLE